MKKSDSKKLKLIVIIIINYTAIKMYITVQRNKETIQCNFSIKDSRYSYITTYNITKIKYIKNMPFPLQMTGL